MISVKELKKEVYIKFHSELTKTKITPYCNNILHSLLHHTLTLKKAVKMYAWENESMLSASNVEIPPLKMAGPMSVTVFRALTDREPVCDRKARHMWAA